MKDAAISPEHLNPERIGVVFASGIGGLITFQEEVMNFAKGDGTPRFNPFFIPKMILDIAAGHISMRHGFRGPNFSVVSACASSTNALMEAFNLIRLGKSDIILTGGSESVISEAGVGGFNAMKALSERNDDFQTASRPYDNDRDGFVMGEGAGVLILEDLDHAVKRGARIYAEIAGTGATADAYHITAPHPEGLGAKNVMLAALDDADMKPEDLDYINTHGTSTPLGDVAEVKAIMDIFGDDAFRINISSTKSMTGHCLGAAGVVEAIACIMAVKDDVVPPTINHFTDDPNLDSRLNFTFEKAQKRTVRAALSNTFGFGGHNACVIVKKISRLTQLVPASIFLLTEKIVDCLSWESWTALLEIKVVLHIKKICETCLVLHREKAPSTEPHSPTGPFATAPTKITNASSTSAMPFSAAS